MTAEMQGSSLVPPIKELAAAFIEFYAAEIVHPEHTGREQRRNSKTILMARKALHVFTGLMEQRQLRVDQLPGDFLTQLWLPAASTYTSSGTGKVNPIELNKRASSANAFVQWLKEKGFPVSHIEPLSLNFTKLPTPKENVMPQDPSFEQLSPAPVPPPAPPAAPPMPQPPLYAPPPPQPMYAPQPQMYQQVAQPAPTPPPTAPRAPAAPQAPRPTAAAQALVQYFPAETERVRVWRVKMDRTNTGFTTHYSGEVSAEDLIDAGGVEPLLMKKFVPLVVSLLAPGTDEVTFEVQAYTKAGSPLTKRGAFTIGIPPNLVPTAATAAAGPTPTSATFILNNRRYYLGPDNRPVAVDPEPAPAPPPPPAPVVQAAPEPSAPLMAMMENVFNRMNARIDQLDDQLRSNQRRGGGDLGGLDGLGMQEAPRAPAPEPLNPLAMLEAVERIVDKRMSNAAPVAAVGSPMEQMKEMLGIMTSVMTLTQPKSINLDTQVLEDRLKLLDAKIDARMGNRDPLKDLATTMNNVKSLFGITGNPLQPAAQAPKSIAEVIGEVFTTAITRLPEAAEAVDKLMQTTARARATGMQVAAEGLRQRATRQPVGFPPAAPRAPQKPAPTPAVAPKAPAAPVAAPPPAPKAAKTPSAPAVTTSDAAYRTPGEGNELAEHFHVGIFKVLAESDRNLRLAAWLDLAKMFAEDEQLKAIPINLETLLSAHRYGRVVETLTTLFNKFGYHNVDLGYTLGLMQDLVRFGIEHQMIDPRYATDFLGETTDDRLKDIAGRAEEAKRRAARAARDEQPAEVTSDEGEEGDEEEEEGDEEEEEPSLGGELTIIAGGDPGEEEEPDEPEPDEPEPTEPTEPEDTLPVDEPEVAGAEGADESEGESEDEEEDEPEASDEEEEEEPEEEEPEEEKEPAPKPKKSRKPRKAKKQDDADADA